MSLNGLNKMGKTKLPKAVDNIMGSPPIHSCHATSCSVFHCNDYVQAPTVYEFDVHDHPKHADVDPSKFKTTETGSLWQYILSLFHKKGTK